MKQIALALALGTLAACSSTPAPTAPRPQPPATPATPGVSALPPIPAKIGALALDIVYPGEGEALGTRDSTFVFGSTGTGQAQLSINGASVRVEPNGTFLAFLPVPASGVYHAVATTPDGQSMALDRRAKVPDRGIGTPAETGARIIPSSITPRGAWVTMPNERIDVSFRGTPGGQATLILPDGSRTPLVETRATNAVAAQTGNFESSNTTRTEVARGVSEYRGFFPARPLLASDTSIGAPTLVPFMTPAQRDSAIEVEMASPRPRPPESTASTSPRRRVAPSPRQGGVAPTLKAPERPRVPLPMEATLELVVGNDTAKSPLPLTVAILTRERTGVAAERDPSNPDNRGFVVGTPGIGGPYTYLWPNGTEVTLTGERGSRYRVRLSPTLSAWTPKSDVRLQPPGAPPAHTNVSTIRMQPTPQSVDVHFAVTHKLPFRVQEGERSITIDLFGATSDVNFMQYGGTDPLIARGEWSQPQDSVFRFRVDLTKPVWGYLVTWASNGDLVLRVRRPPVIDMQSPLRGLLIAVDPGHPPAGAIGPTRLTEADANLANALALKPMLEAAGARVLMTRSDNTAVPLNARPLRAIMENADLLVSLHNNAFPDGVNPFENNGTSVYYYQPHSIDLARDLQVELLHEFNLRNLGIGRADLALVRPTWMPSALTETMFMMIPQQEAALRDPAVNQRIARAHVRGLEKFLRDRAQGITAPAN